MIDDMELLSRYAEDQSQSAFAELVKRHIDLVYSIAMRRVGGNHALAQDVAQSVFADLAKKASKLRGRSVLISWLFTSTQFAAAKALRTESRRRARDFEAMTTQPLGNETEPNVDGVRLRAILDELLLRAVWMT
jgi:RNA polymerase sigma factor (sigma-70 family)